MQPTSLNTMQNRMDEKQRDLVSAQSTKTITEQHSNDEFYTIILDEENDATDSLDKDDIVMNHQNPSDGSIGQV